MLDLFKNTKYSLNKRTPCNTHKKLSFVFCFLFIFLALPLAIAQEDPTFQFNKEFDLKRPCSDSGFFCDSTYQCNITLIYPDGNLLVNNQIMTNQVSFRNITILQPNNKQLGIIKGIESCNNVTLAGLNTFDVIITANGKKFQAFPNEFFIIILGLVMIGAGFVTERLRLFKHLGGILLMISGVITLFPGYNFINYSTLLGKSLGAILIGLGFYFLIEDSFSRDKQEEAYGDGRPLFE